MSTHGEPSALLCPEGLGLSCLELRTMGNVAQPNNTNSKAQTSFDPTSFDPKP